MSRLTCLLTATLGLFVAIGVARSDEKKVSLEDLPKVVSDAVKAKFPDAEVTGASKETEDGKTEFEISIKNKDQKIDVTLTTDGTITGLEKEIKADQLPAPVTDTLKDKYPGATYRKIEEIVKVTNGTEKLESFEVLLVTAESKKIEVVLSPEGKVTKEEAKGSPKK